MSSILLHTSYKYIYRNGKIRNCVVEIKRIGYNRFHVFMASSIDGRDLSYTDICTDTAEQALLQLESMINTKWEYDVLDCTYLSKIIQHHYNIRNKFDIKESSELKNKACYYIKVENRDLNKYCDTMIKKFKETNGRTMDLEIIMTDLCNKNIVCPGEYLIGDYL